MIPRHEPPAGRPGSPDDPATARFVATLEAAYAAANLAPPARASLRQTLLEQAAAYPRPRPPRRIKSLRLRLAALAALVLGAAGGATVYQAWQTPGPVSAQTILDRAVQALPRGAVNQVVHQTFEQQIIHQEKPAHAGAHLADIRSCPASGVVRILDVWIQLDARGQTLRYDGYAHSLNGTLLLREVGGGGTITVVNRACGRPSVSVGKQRLHPQPQMFSAGWNWGQSLRAMQAAPGETKRLLPRLMLDGHAMDVVQLRSSGSSGRQITTLYIDAQTYSLHQLTFDSTYRADTNTMATLRATTRLVGYERVPLAKVPPFVFKPLVDPPSATRANRRAAKR